MVLTQSLCRVCAVSADDVGQSGASCDIVSGAPSTLAEVGLSIEAIGEACGVPLRGRRERATFEAQLAEVTAAVASARLQQNGNDEGTGSSAAASAAAAPSVLLLEWLDPVFDGGHWVPGMVRAAGCVPCLNGVEGARSSERTWADVAAADPDVVLVACCGFDLPRNAADAAAALAGGNDAFAALRAVRTGRAFVLDGNRYFARPSPALAAGTALVARCAFADEPAVVAALDNLSFMPECAMSNSLARVGRNIAWAPLDTEPESATAAATAAAAAAAADPTSTDTTAPEPSEVPDIEDSFVAVHAAACARGDFMYTDPATGYLVMTSVKHQARGKCCGSGCRHCPYAHANVKDKALKIQQPSFIHTPAEGLAPQVLVLLWSGGKDSFLALRALLRTGEVAPAGVVLLTTFDAHSRMVAHQVGWCALHLIDTCFESALILALDLKTRYCLTFCVQFQLAPLLPGCAHQGYRAAGEAPGRGPPGGAAARWARRRPRLRVAPGGGAHGGQQGDHRERAGVRRPAPGAHPAVAGGRRGARPGGHHPLPRMVGRRLL